MVLSLKGAFSYLLVWDSTPVISPNSPNVKSTLVKMREVPRLKMHFNPIPVGQVLNWHSLQLCLCSRPGFLSFCSRVTGIGLKGVCDNVISIN